MESRKAQPTRRRTTTQQQVKDLQLHLESLQLQTQQLEEKNRALNVQAQLMERCCGLLDQLSTAGHGRGWPSTGWLPAEEDDSMQPQQQQGSGQQEHEQEGAATGATLGSSSAGFAHDAAAAWLRTLSEMPAYKVPYAAAPVTLQPLHQLFSGDYLGILQYCLSEPPYPGVASLTVKQFADSYSDLVKEAALHLALAERQQPFGAGTEAQEGPDGSLHPLLALQHLMLRHGRIICGIELLHPDDLINKLRVLDVNTGQLSDRPEQAWQRTCWVLDQLQLSDSQQQMLIAGSHVFKRLVDKMLAERQTMLVQQGKHVEERFLPSSSEALQNREDKAQLLQLMVRRERFLGLCSTAFCAGVLNVLQLAQAVVLSWPVPPQVNLFGPILIQRSES